MPRHEESSNGCSDADNDRRGGGVEVEAKRRQSKENIIGRKRRSISFRNRRNVKGQLALESKHAGKPDGNSLCDKLSCEIPSDVKDIYNTTNGSSSSRCAGSLAVNFIQRAVNDSEYCKANLKGNQLSDQTFLGKKSSSFPSGLSDTGTPMEFDVLEMILTPLSSGRRRDRHRLAFDKQSLLTASKPVRSIDFPGLDSPDTESVEIDIIERTFLEMDEKSKSRKSTTKVAKISRRKTSVSVGKVIKNRRCKQTKVKNSASKSSVNPATRASYNWNDDALNVSRHETENVVTTKVKQRKLNRKKLPKKSGEKAKKSSPCKHVKTNVSVQARRASSSCPRLGKMMSGEHVSNSSGNRTGVNTSTPQKKKLLSNMKKGKTENGKQLDSPSNVTKMKLANRKVKVIRQQENARSVTENDAGVVCKADARKDVRVRTKKGQR